MDVDKIFYIFYYQQSSSDKRPNRMVVFYSRDTLRPILAYRLAPRSSVPDDYYRLEHLTVTLRQFKILLKDFEELGILQPYTAGIPEGTKSQAS